MKQVTNYYAKCKKYFRRSTFYTVMVEDFHKRMDKDGLFSEAAVCEIGFCGSSS
jgi:hypothetical protein